MYTNPMMLFQSYRDNRFSASDIRLLESDGISIAWGNFHVDEELVMQKYSSEDNRNTGGSGNKYFLSHFHLSGRTESETSGRCFRISDTQHTFFSFREHFPINLHITPSGRGVNSFFEYSFSQAYFTAHFPEDSPTMNDMANRMEKSGVCWAGRNLYITPSMLCLMREIIEQPYTGTMMSLYLESKIMELYLAQVRLFDTSFGHDICLSRYDMDRLYEARDIIAGNLNEHISISTLARRVGINQTKLKTGFKQLFGRTIFDYAIELKMNLAVKLLEEGRLSLSEISEMTGYSHPNHFSYAFKKRFGLPPGRFM